MTNYVILEGDESGSWRPMGETEAHNAERAVLNLGSDGFYVAIPKRHWNPKQVTTETLTRSRISEGEPEVRTAVTHHEQPPKDFDSDEMFAPKKRK